MTAPAVLALREHVGGTTLGPGELSSPPRSEVIRLARVKLESGPIEVQAQPRPGRHGHSAALYRQVRSREAGFQQAERRETVGGITAKGCRKMKGSPRADPGIDARRHNRLHSSFCRPGRDFERRR